jgi:hypothetical protein
MVSEVGRSSEAKINTPTTLNNGHRSVSKINTANSLQPKTKTRRMHNKTVLAHPPTTEEVEEEAQTVLAHPPTTEAEEEAQTVLAHRPTTEEVEEEAQEIQEALHPGEEEETLMILTTVHRRAVAPQVSFRPRNQSEQSTVKESFVYLRNFHG